MATTDLKLEESGALKKPGPVGRGVRLVFGLLCLYYVYGLITAWGHILTPAGAIIPLIWNGILPGLFLVSYVINIGFSRAWKKWPAIASVVIMLGVAGTGYILTGSIETSLLAHTVHAWEVYVFSHLGLAFMFAAMLGTPGCEMRAFHHLFSLITRIPTKEHHCPVGPLTPIDKWEAQQKWMR
ncbi:hypothetical protein [Luteithermobacter gelatinilyticus]|uniref:hypothetical protein n=1 Tax=Luteithermobacter gelatinilyticus TaxID=2582913 RepID=UPI001105F96D|nr:hypothetical protein [Luteithermobacter gelatinilyticus]